MPGTLCTIWLVNPCPMNPAPIMPTRMGLPSASRRLSALSTMIMIPSLAPSSYGHPAPHLAFDLGERPPAAVLVRDLGDGKRPFQTKLGIVVKEAPLAVRRVELPDLVARLGRVFEDLVPVREALGDVERALVGGVELDGHVLEEGGALRAEVDDDVEDRAPGGPDELGLRLGRELEVHPAHRAPLDVERDVGLRDGRLQPVSGELVLAEGAREVPAAVLAALDVDDERALELGLGEDHGLSVTRS